MRLLWIEVCVLARASVPNRHMREAIVVAAALWCGIGSVGMIVALNQSRRGVTPEALVFIMSLTVAAATAAALAAGARVLDQIDRVDVWCLAPLSPAHGALLSIGAVATTASAVALAFMAPVMIAALASNMLVGVLTVASAVMATIVGIITAMLVLSAACRYGGVALASRIGRIVPLPLAIGGTSIFRYLSRSLSSLNVDVVLILGLLAALTPLGWWLAARSWVAALRVGNRSQASPEPLWGSPMWHRAFLRTPAPWALAGVIPIAVNGAVRIPGMVSIILVVVPMACVFHLVRWEDDCPDRYRLAPRAKALRRSLVFQVGGPACAIVVVVAALLSRSALWFISVTVLLCAGPLCSLVLSKRKRLVAEAALVAAGVVAGLLA